MHPDNGEAQHWNLTPGNLYNKPQKLTITADSKVSLTLSKTIAPIPPGARYQVHSPHPDANLKPDLSKRFHISGYNRIQQEKAYKFYQRWVSPSFLRFLVIKLQHANPYYDDSYAVNSANLGHCSDAIETELMPPIEKEFRGIGQGWARFTYGGSGENEKPAL